MTILTDTDHHEIAPIKGARLTARPRPSNFACKQVMALTGVAFGLFVLFHMIGKCSQVCSAGIPLTAIAAFNNEQRRARTKGG